MCIRFSRVGKFIVAESRVDEPGAGGEGKSLFAGTELLCETMTKFWKWIG